MLYNDPLLILIILQEIYTWYITLSVITTCHHESYHKKMTYGISRDVNRTYITPKTHFISGYESPNGSWYDPTSRYETCSYYNMQV